MASIFFAAGRHNPAGLWRRHYFQIDAIILNYGVFRFLGTVFTAELEILLSKIIFYSFYSAPHGIEDQRESGHSTN